MTVCVLCVYNATSTGLSVVNNAFIEVEQWPMKRDEVEELYAGLVVHANETVAKREWRITIVNLMPLGE